MEKISLRINEVINIKNKIQSIRIKTARLEKNYDFRKHGKNRLYGQIQKDCEEIERLLAEQSIEIHKHLLPGPCRIEDIDNPEEKDSKRSKKRNIILRKKETGEWWIPICAIPEAFNIHGEIAIQDLERFFLKRNKIKYLYLKMVGEKKDEIEM